MREAERLIIFRYFLSLTGDRYSVDTRKNRFLFFFLNPRIEVTKGATRKKMTPSESRRNGLSKGAIFFEKYAFLPSVKNRRKRVKIRPFGNGFHL